MSKEKDFALCLASGLRFAKPEMLRFIKGPDGKAYLDLSGRAPGEGVYLKPEPGFLAQADIKVMLAAALGAEVTEQLPQDVVQALTLKVLHSLGLAKKAGVLVLGHDKVKEAAAKGRLALVVMAHDASPSTRQDISKMAQRHGLPLYFIGERSRLSALFGQANATVIGLEKAPISATVQTALLWYSAASNERLGND